MRPSTNVQVRDLYWVLRPTICLCRACGLFPIKFTRSVNQRIHSINHIAAVYGMTLLVLESAGLLWSINLGIEGTESNVAMVRVTMSFQYCFIAIMLIVTYVTGILNVTKIGSLIEIVNSHDSVLRQLGIQLDYSAELRRTYIHLGITWTTIVAMIFIDFFSDFEIVVSARHPLIWVTWIFPVFVVDIGICLFTSIVFSLRQRFMDVNESLQNVIDETNSPLFETIPTHRRNALKVRRIAVVHGVLCEATNNLNAIFGFIFVATITNAFVILTIVLYFTFRELKNIPNISIFHIVGLLNWGILNIYSTIYTVISCNTTQYQADRAAELIHKFHVQGINTPLNSAIQMFSMQLNHQKVFFSAAGFFPIDSSLLQMIISAVTTYLIILIQFDSTTATKAADKLTNTSDPIVPNEEMHT